MFRIIVFFLSFVCLCGCDKDSTIIGDSFSEEINKGSLIIDFEITHQWIPEEKIIRVGIHIAKDQKSIYRGEYYRSINVSNRKRYYNLHLDPGVYYIESIISCLCMGDSCSAGGFHGNQYATKHTLDRVEIEENTTRTIIPRFY